MARSGLCLSHAEGKPWSMALSASVYLDSSVCSKVVERKWLIGNATRFGFDLVFGLMTL